MWCQPFESAMGSCVIVLLSPVVMMRRVDRSKQPAIEVPIAQHTVEALIMPVLPRAARINKMRIDMLRMQPCRHPLRNALWAIVTLPIHRSATSSK